MSKPILDVEIQTPDDKAATVKAVIDSGSFYTIVREDKVPSAASIVWRKTPRVLRAAVKGSQPVAIGDVSLVLTVSGRQIDDVALVCRDMAQDMIIGAGTMQKWDISILNRNGHTEVSVGRDMHDADLTEVD